MTASRKDIEHIARLAALGLDQAAVEALTEEVSRILQYVSQLESVGTDVAEDSLEEDPQRTLGLRDDEPYRTPLAIPLEKLAPAFRDGLFLVPRLVGLDDDA